MENFQIILPGRTGVSGMVRVVPVSLLQKPTITFASSEWPMTQASEVGQSGSASISHQTRCRVETRMLKR